VAIFGSPDPVARTERLVILAETYETDRQSLEELRRHIDTVSTDLLGTPPDEVVLAPPHTVPKTSSGKIRRSTSRELYEQGGLGGVRERYGGSGCVCSLQGCCRSGAACGEPR
jgi:acyl-coenzyme A synthetase/AMP-(fatty) acid ligase